MYKYAPTQLCTYMQDAIKNVVDDYNNMIDPIRKINTPSSIDAINALNRVLTPIYANQYMEELFNQSAASSSIVNNFTPMHQSLLDNIHPEQHISSLFSHLSIASNLSLYDPAHLMLVSSTDRLISNINFEAIHGYFPSKIPFNLGLEDLMGKMISSYITGLPDFVLPGATRELYTTSVALNTLSPHDDKDKDAIESDCQIIAKVELEISDCLNLLQQIDPGLARPYLGARDALNSNNPDRARHIMSSLRELWNHLLRHLAPDELLVPWISDRCDPKNLLHEGKPTRQARILYICRGLDNPSLTDFVTHDTQSLIRMINLFNRIHELECTLTDEQLRALLFKTESWMMYLLQIHLSDNNGIN